MSADDKTTYRPAIIGRRGPMERKRKRSLTVRNVFRALECRLEAERLDLARFWSKNERQKSFSVTGLKVGAGRRKNELYGSKTNRRVGLVVIGCKWTVIGLGPHQ